MRGSAIAWQEQRLMLTVNHQTDHGIPSAGVRGRTEGAEGVCNLIGRTTISTNQTLQSPQGLNHQPKSTHRGSHGSSHIYSRGWPCGASVGGEAPGSVKARCSIVGECQVKEAGVGGWVGEHPHRRLGGKMGLGGFRGEVGLEKVITFEM
jgi:hypothetical protein